MYSIELTKKSRDFIKKLPIQDRQIILNKINSIKNEPFRSLKKLKNTKLWRLRILKYRAIVDVIISGRRIIVLRVGYRKNVY